MSDQDFFFDEEDEKPAKTEQAPASKSAPRKPSGTKAASGSRTPARAAAPAPAGDSFFEQSLNMGVVALLVVIALLLGVIVGVFVGQSRAENAVLNGSSVTNTSGGGSSAPALTQDQLNSGQLPAGHPSVGASSSTNATGQ